jgi:hypothetical protein
MKVTIANEAAVRRDVRHGCRRKRGRKPLPNVSTDTIVEPLGRLEDAYAVLNGGPSELENLDGAYAAINDGDAE